ncbi:MAG TPA: OpgC domain-containing protein [Pseudacidobacterium sp.]|nr:OpgC domain-containing protein [Pseudacidobacterium sp.]
MHIPKPQRQPELDALRGLFLVWMTLTHLPTRFSDFVNSPIGYVSSAEGFVFLSALLVGRVYMRQAAEGGAELRAALWKRSLRIYAYHLLMLALTFTVAAAYAVRTHRAALYNLLNFYIAHPFVAVVGSVLLLYCPPLLDILPMYVIFLFFTPLVLTSAVKRGWAGILATSMAFWLFAQFGLRDVVHNVIVHVTHLPIPLQETGAFNLFAWQAVWISGLWLGAKSAVGEMPLRRIPGYVVTLSAVVCLFFIGVRHSWLGPHLTQQALGMKLDKWQIGPLRVINLVTFTIVFYWLRKYVKRVVAIEPFLTLGKASLHVFCAHVFFVFVGLALLVNDVPELHGWPAAVLLAGTFAGLILVAVREVRNQRAKRLKREQQQIVQVFR